MQPLVDRYGRIHDYLRVSVTDRCNLRCIYCMPAEGIACAPRANILTFEEIARSVRVMAGMGMRKVRLTGGEPTVRRDLDRLVAELTGIPGIETVALTTNGVLFAQQAEQLKRAGLSAVNISLDSLDAEAFRRITLRDGFTRVMDAIDTAVRLRFAPLKINMVVMPGINDHEVLEFVELARQRPIHVRFIEYMPFKGNRWDPSGFLPFAELKRRVESRYELLALPDNFTQNRVARDYAIPGFRGTIGFISSLSDSFCAYCSRIRITAEGALKACLFFPAQLNLRDLLRSALSDVELEQAIREAVLRKPQGHPALEELEAASDLSMIQIGG